MGQATRDETAQAAKECFQELIAKMGPEAVANKKLAILGISLGLSLYDAGFKKEELEHIDPLTHPLCREPLFLAFVKEKMAVIEEVLNDEEL